MSYQDKLESVRSLLLEHNSNLEGEEGKVDIDKFFAKLKAAGGTTETALSESTWEDLEDCGLPKILARKIAQIFRKKDDSSTNTNTNVDYLSPKKAERLPVGDLISYFDPEDVTNAVGKRLREIVGDKPFIVYSSGRLVDVEATKKLLLEIKTGYPAVNSVKVNGEIKKTYRLGELPDNFVDENPLYPNRPLRNGECDQTGRSWTGVPLNVRQLLRLVLTTEYRGKDISIDTIHNLIQMAVSTDAWTSIRDRYRQAALEFDKLTQKDELPKLKVRLGKDSPYNSQNLAHGQKVSW